MRHQLQNLTKLTARFVRMHYFLGIGREVVSPILSYIWLSIDHAAHRNMRMLAWLPPIAPYIPVY